MRQMLIQSFDGSRQAGGPCETDIGFVPRQAATAPAARTERDDAGVGATSRQDPGHPEFGSFAACREWSNALSGL